ncbi:prephenate dehydratase [Stackebrandtia soli]|uniref:prephenate dehydratase n=1 Tax=Stackebrandtia soli TaxID=1892856 RepID=UPI0039EB9592
MPGVPPSRFAYLGPPGSFSEAALRRLPAARRGTTIPVSSIPDALDAVRDGDVDAALVPLENSQEGSVPVTLDGLVDGAPLLITAEVVLPVTFVLAVASKSTPVDRVVSHPHAIAQCRSWLRRHYPQATLGEVLSTSAAATAVANGTEPACVCSPLAAEQRGLTVIATDVGDGDRAATRFALVSRPGPAGPPTGNDVTSLVVYISHDKVGALESVLTQLSVRGVNLTRIESRPTGERLGRYSFYLDCAGHINEPGLGEALMGLRRVCADVRFLGSYPRDGDDGPVPAPIGLARHDFADAVTWLRGLREAGA